MDFKPQGKCGDVCLKSAPQKIQPSILNVTARILTRAHVTHNPFKSGSEIGIGTSQGSRHNTNPPSQAKNYSFSQGPTTDHSAEILIKI
jgi:hypothetical protein